MENKQIKIKRKPGPKRQDEEIEDVVDNLYDASNVEFEDEIIKQDPIHLPSIEENNCVPEALAHKSPLELFQLMFTEELFQMITDTTNQYMNRNIKGGKGRQKIFTREEMENFIYIYIFSSVVNLPEMEMLWSDSRYYSTIIPKVMNYNKFKRINKFLHLSDSNEEPIGDTPIVSPNNKTHKFNDFLKYLNNKWTAYYRYSQYITIDECMSAFKGRICFRQTIKEKKKQTGIKFFAKSSASKGYVYRLIPYTGKNFEYDQTLGIGTSVLCDFAKPHMNKTPKVHMTFDNFYTSMYVINYLQQNNIDFTCTWNNKRKCFPPEIKNIDLKRREDLVVKHMIGTNVRFLMYRGKKQVNLASNVYSGNIKEYYNKNNKKHIKPEMIAVYNMTKSGVDQIDACTNTYSCQRKTYKWWKAVFWYLIDVTIHNATVIYFTNNKQNKSKALFFRTYLYEQWFSKYALPKRIREKKTIKEKSDKHKMIIMKNRKECVKCKEDINKKYKKRTTIKCDTCDVYLCKECFEDYHKGLKRENKTKKIKTVKVEEKKEIESDVKKEEPEGKNAQPKDENTSKPIIKEEENSSKPSTEETKMETDSNIPKEEESKKVEVAQIIKKESKMEVDDEIKAAPTPIVEKEDIKMDIVKEDK